MNLKNLICPWREAKTLAEEAIFLSCRGNALLDGRKLPNGESGQLEGRRLARVLHMANLLRRQHVQQLLSLRSPTRGGRESGLQDLCSKQSS